MENDKIFYGTILALVTLVFGHPWIALLIFLLSTIL